MSISLSASPSSFAPRSPLPRPSSAASIRSVRAHSPSLSGSLDDPVAIRNQMSTIKHTIRHQQAQLQTLETLLQRAPRLPALTSTSASPPPSPTTDSALSTSTLPGMSSPPPPSPSVKRRSSHDILLNLAGPDSSLPIPRKETPSLVGTDGIPEGVPFDFAASRRTSSPTRSHSRIPIASVGSARALATLADASSPSPRGSHVPSVVGTSPPSPSPHANHRLSMAPLATTRMLADLQNRATEQGTALENTKAQLRASQRAAAQLARQVEDLKEVRERLRLENEGLNNVVARKERLLQEVLERARKAEAEAATLKAQVKNETASTKKSLREMEAALAESTALSSKSEREYLTLRDSLRDMKAGWRADVDGLREEMRRREEAARREGHEVARKYQKLLEEQKARKGDVKTVEALRAEGEGVRKEVEDGFREEIAQLKAELTRSAKASDKAAITADYLAGELLRMRRLMQKEARPDSDPEGTPPAPP